MKQLIKNYTTEIPVERTIAEIQKLLADNGARGIALEYDGSGTLKDIFFRRCFTVVDLLFSLSVLKEPNDPSDREVLW